jgi:hypothetical protein
MHTVLSRSSLLCLRFAHLIISELNLGDVYTSFVPTTTCHVMGTKGYITF